MAKGDELVRMEVKGLMLDPTSNVPIVILREKDGSELLPIWIGVFEANAIALRLEGVDPPRPMTHDLLANVLRDLGWKLLRIVVTDLDDSTFFARLIVSRDGEEHSVDSRPSDAIALALRLEAPIFASPSVFSKAKAAELADRIASEEKLKQWLEQIDPDELGKYTM